MEVKTKALILRRYPFQERRWIVRLYTPGEGILSALLSQRQGTAVLPGALMRVSLRLRPQREIQRLTELEWAHMYRRFYHDPAHTPYLLLIVEWLNQCLYVPDGGLFDWIAAKLAEIDLSPSPQRDVQRFLAELLPRLGGAAPSPEATLSEIELHYQQLFPNWKPIHAISLATFANL
ncbi:MAG: recombination protein O N-terminal domain-containing protein [Bacteroidia bacterium]|nr:recombination protein O N-terminal domain-containing protein [Bacteroidia bacterium]MCX7764211.1 recombination protein O N-terminal domain-containing protein [Bacteroidia bacterium]MDW8058180.1 recombination protein O N-terminal domain-containing protein [Bacteroidia bacterium]